jgi:hypothetical protein
VPSCSCWRCRCRLLQGRYSTVTRAASRRANAWWPERDVHVAATSLSLHTAIMMATVLPGAFVMTRLRRCVQVVVAQPRYIISRGAPMLPAYPRHALGTSMCWISACCPSSLCHNGLSQNTSHAKPGFHQPIRPLCNIRPPCTPAQAQIKLVRIDRQQQQALEHC